MKQWVLDPNGTWEPGKGGIFVLLVMVCGIIPFPILQFPCPLIVSYLDLHIGSKLCPIFVQKHKLYMIIIEVKTIHGRKLPGPILLYSPDALWNSPEIRPIRWLDWRTLTSAYMQIFASNSWREPALDWRRIPGPHGQMPSTGRLPGIKAEYAAS